MITQLVGCEICDPTLDLEKSDLTKNLVRSDDAKRPSEIYISDDKGIVEGNTIHAHQRIQSIYRFENHIAVAGGIDLHTHIGGGKVNLARLLMPPKSMSQREQSPHGNQNTFDDRLRPLSKALSSPVPSTFETGRRYLAMGYTACFEPAVLPANAYHSLLEMEDTPYIDTGGYLLLGNEDLLLNALATDQPQSLINDYVAWMVQRHRCVAVKVVNAGGINAFKFNVRALDVDESHPVYGITPRLILRSLARAVDELHLAHPLHVHCSNLGVPGNIESTLKTIDAVEGHRIHLTHAQFHCYGTVGPHGFSSEARQLIEVVNRSSNVTVDVGQVLFGQTVTLSADVMHQFANRSRSRPNTNIFLDAECQAGCGVLPFHYRESQYVHSLQWAIGLELFLMIEDPWKVYLTTDHPNGGPFTSYPHLIRLLMDYDFRMSVFDRLHPDMKTTSNLPSLKREYSLDEIITITRCGPAKALGLSEMGHLRPGACGDIVIYRKDSNPELQFMQPEYVFRRGKLVFRNGEFLEQALKKHHSVEIAYDASIEDYLRRNWHDYYIQSIQQ